MTNEKFREQAIQNLAELLRIMPFKVEFKVVKKPKCIKIIYEVTQEHMDEIMRRAAEGKE